MKEIVEEEWGRREIIRKREVGGNVGETTDGEMRTYSVVHRTSAGQVWWLDLVWGPDQECEISARWVSGGVMACDRSSTCAGMCRNVQESAALTFDSCLEVLDPLLLPD